jgi:poly(U)-specific endoribonuclease
VCTSVSSQCNTLDRESTPDSPHLARSLLLQRQQSAHAQPQRCHNLQGTVFAGWWGQTKAVSSIFMGSTPEFELALYTMCFLGGNEENVVWLDDFQVLIKAYRIRSNKGGELSAKAA